MTGRGVMLVSALALAACGGSETLVSDPTAGVSLTTVTTQAGAATTSAVTEPTPVPTSPASTTPTTSTTVAPTTAAPTTTSTVPANPLPTPGPAPATAVAVVEADLVELDPGTGEIQRTIVEFFEGDGVFRSGLELTPDRSSAYYSEAYEDAWFSCEASPGAIARVDLGDGTSAVLDPGWSPSLSPSGDRLAFVTSNVCVPDPEAPEIWVLTPGDRVVVVELATSNRVEIVTATSPVSYDDPNAVEWVEFHPSGDLLVGIEAGDVHRVSGSTPGIVQDGPVVFSSELRTLPVIAYDDALVALVEGDEGSSTLVAVDLANGAVTSVWESEVPISVAGEPGGNLLVIDSTASDSIVAGNLTVLAVDASVGDVAW